MVGIVGAMSEEVSLLRSKLEQAQTETIGAFSFLSGKLDEKPVVLIQCGIGKVAAAAGCALLIERYKPFLVINTGSAGGMLKEQSIGDVVVANALIYHDVDVTVFGYARGQLPGQNLTFPVQEKYMLAAEKAINELKAENVLPSSMSHRRGLIGSGDVFMEDDEQAASLRAAFPAIAAVDMEAASIAHTCLMLGVDAMVIRALSDIAGSESPMKFDEFLPVAALHSSEIVRRIVRDIEPAAK